MQGIMEEFEAGNIYILLYICVYGRPAHMTSSIENKLQNPSNSFLRISCWSYPRACTRKQVHVRVYTRMYTHVRTRVYVRMRVQLLSEGVNALRVVCVCVGRVDVHGSV